MTSSEAALGIRSNLSQFILLVIVNAFVGSLVGFYSLLPLIGEQEFGLTSNTILLSYVVAFGISKALSNYYAGRLADKFGRKKLLSTGWLLATPVPVLIIFAPTWGWIALANILLGISQGLTWSMTVIMKIDLAGPARRGLATGLNEFAGYIAVSMTLVASGYIASRYSLRPEPFYLGVVFSFVGLVLSALTVKETKPFTQVEIRGSEARGQRGSGYIPKNIFLHTSFRDPALSTSCLAGLVNNLIFGMSWGLFPLFYASQGLGVEAINYIKAFYPGVWGVLQLVSGPLSDRLGRKWLIVSGQLLQASGVWITAASSGLTNWIFANALLGLGTALVYPALLAAISDVSNPTWRGEALGTYRFWRDLGYAVGAVFSGVVADLFNISLAINLVGFLTALSAVAVALRMYETLVGASGQPRIVNGASVIKVP